MAIVIIGFCVFAYLLYSREWKKFFNFKIIIAALSFFVGIIPVLYAYHHQFGEEGIRFILFNQSVNRLTASGFEETSPDYSFFFHTLLWAFLPFSLAFYVGIFEKSAFFLKNRFRKTEGVEFLTLGGFWLVMLLFSASKFKLPHYLNGLIAVLAVFTASYLFDIFKRNQVKKIKVLYIIQLVVVFGTLLGVGLLTYFFTGVDHIIMYTVAVLIFIYLMMIIFKKEDLFKKYVFMSLVFAIGVNIFLNTQFYPVLTQYQGSYRLAQSVNNERIAKDRIFATTGSESWAFDFYTKRNTSRTDVDKLKKGDYFVIYKDALQSVNRKYKIVLQENDYRITRLSLKFLNPKTRPEQFDKIYLIQILD